MTPEIQVVDDAQQLARTGAEVVARALREAVSAHGEASLVLSGGTTPGQLYAMLAMDQEHLKIPWPQVQLFWGDERPVGPTHPESNYRLAREKLLQHVPVPQEHIHRIQGELRADEAAWIYEEELRQLYHLGAGKFPRFTICLLGLGPDGHTASLFPGTDVLDERRRIAAGVHVPQYRTSRVTLTVPTFNNAAAVVFLVSGRSKAEIVQKVLEEDGAAYPARRIIPAQGRLLWLLDSDAAGRVRKKATDEGGGA